MLSFGIKSTNLLFLVNLLCCINCLNYGDLKHIGLSCPRKNSCYGFGGYKNGLTYLDRSCECDPDCVFYNDCCIDATRSRKSERKLADNNIKCLNYGNNSLTGVYAVSDCSKNWNGHSRVREKCVGLFDFNNPLTAIPVTNVAQKVTYRNLFCAECNSASMESLSLFHLEVICESLPDISKKQILDGLTYNERMGSWGINRLNSLGKATEFTKCNLKFNVPKNISRSVRFCRSNLVSKCAPDWASPQIKRSCEEYMSIVYDQRDVAYRNPHCAICNHKTVEELSCTSRGSDGKIPFSFALMHDVLRNYRRKKKEKMKTPKCPSGSTYDPFFKKCKRLMCAIPGRVFMGGKCVVV